MGNIFKNKDCWIKEESASQQAGILQADSKVNGTQQNSDEAKVISSEKCDRERILTKEVNNGDKSNDENDVCVTTDPKIIPEKKLIKYKKIEWKFKIEKKAEFDKAFVVLFSALKTIQDIIDMREAIIQLRKDFDEAPSKLPEKLIEKKSETEDTRFATTTINAPQRDRMLIESTADLSKTIVTLPPLKIIRKPLGFRTDNNHLSLFEQKKRLNMDKKGKAYL